MKRLILAAAIVVGISSHATAQTSGSNSSNSTSGSSANDIKPSRRRSTTKGRKNKSRKAKAVPIDSLNNRKMYNWKDGQRATPTGHEATGTGGGYAALGKDTTTARRDSTKQ